MNKKYILIGGGLVLILGGLAYYFYSKKQIDDLKAKTDTGAVVPRPNPYLVRKDITSLKPAKKMILSGAELGNLKSRTLAGA